MRILFVAMGESIHTVRWISQFRNLGWDLHLFPVADWEVHPDMQEVTVHALLYQGRKKVSGARIPRAWPLPRGSGLARRSLAKIAPDRTERARRLARTIERVKPDVIHTLEIQHAGYLALDARAFAKDGNWPPWLVSNWGSDIYLFGRLPEHAEKIAAVMAACDYYHAECQRDLDLGIRFGFRGRTLPVMPGAGGFELDAMRALRVPGATSMRRTIALKGLQNWAGRALVAVKAIELCADALNGYTVFIYSCSPDVRLAARLVSQKTGIPFVFSAFSWSRDDVLRLHGQARVSIGLNISDAISTSLLEAMIMGSFPIQSNTSCGNELISSGHNGFFVEPESPEDVARALRKALVNDELVDSAAEANARLADEHLDLKVIRPRAVAAYEEIVGSAKE